MAARAAKAIGRRAAIVAAHAGALSFVLAASTAVAEDLRRTLEHTYLSSPRIEASRAATRSADETVAEARSGWRPTVTLSASAGRARDRFRQPGPGGDTVTSRETRGPLSGSLTVQQPLYRGGRTLAEIDRAEAGVRQSRLGLQSIEQETLLEAALAYLDLYRDQQILAIAEQTVTGIEQQLKIVHARFARQDVTRTDLSQAEARMARTIDDLTQAQGNVEVGIAAFERVVGRLPIGDLTPPRVDLIQPESLEHALTLATRNPRLRAAVEVERVADADVDIAGSQLLPSVHLRGALRQQQETDREDLRRTTGEMLVEVTIPLYQAGGPSAQVRQRKHIASQRRLETYDVRRRVTDLVKATWQSLETARARITTLEVQAAAAAEALSGVESEARVGTRTVLDVLDAEQELFAARINLMRARRNEQAALFELYTAIGALDVDGLALDVAPYDPKPHYHATRGRIWGTGLLPAGETSSASRSE